MPRVYAGEVTPSELWRSLSEPSWRVAGTSAGGHPLWVRTWGQGGGGVLFHAAIHGDEPLGAFCLIKLAEELDAAPPARQVTIWPVVNPDGYLAGRKNNGRNVDLNRNFAASNWQPDLGPGYFPGKQPGSEPETQALTAWIDANPPARIVTLHSPFRMVNYDGPAREVAERMSALNGYPITEEMGYPTPGSFGTLYGVERGVPVITLEIPRMTNDQAWAENRDALLAALE
jgi:murein peptide amidase A